MFDKKYLFLILAFVLNTKAFALIVNSEALDPVYMAPYVCRNEKAERAGKIKRIRPQRKKKINRPKFRLNFDRKLFFSYKKSVLKKNLSGLDYLKVSKQPIGIKHGISFYIVPEGAALKSYKWGQWKITKNTKKFLKKYTKYVSTRLLKKKERSGTKAFARISTNLSKYEVKYLNKRRPIVNRNLQKFTGISFNENETPSIAVCASGGGYRAMLSTLGLFSGLEEINLLDGITYISGLSGSTWFMTPWLYFNESVSDYKKRLKPKVKVKIGKKVVKKNGKKKIKNNFPLRAFIQYLIEKKEVDKQSVTSVDLYGALLADKLFSDLNRFKRQNVKLSDLRLRIKKGKKPYPILTAVQPGPPYVWFEFTPYEIGTSWHNSFASTWAAGRRFLNGKSMDFAKEQSLGFYMGVWGSAYTIHFDGLLEEFEDSLSPFVKTSIEKSIEFIGAENRRAWPARLNNFAYGAKNAFLNNVEKLTLVDAGLDFNLPFPPLLRAERPVDIIIVMDASKTVYDGAPDLRSAEKWARKNGVKFPKIDYEKASKNIFSVFKDENDPTVPTIIYFPLVKNSKYNTKFDPEEEIKNGFCGTFNFIYSSKQYELLTRLTQYNLTEAKNAIVQAIKDKVEFKKSLSKTTFDKIETEGIAVIQKEVAMEAA